MKPTYEQLEQQLAVAISERDAAVNAERIWEKSMMEACGEDGPASVAAEIAALRAQRDTALESLRQQLAAVVAENAWLKSAAEFATASDMWEELGGDVLRYQYKDWYVDKLKAAMKTPATDAYLAEVRAHARNEGINYAASRLAAAYNHGFIGKSMSEVADVVHMILDAKTDLANDTMPAADGLSGEYAEKSLVEFAAQLRQGEKQ